MPAAVRTPECGSPGVGAYRSTHVEHSMGINKEQVEGRANVVGGRVAAAAGQIIGSAKVEEEGKAREAVGKAQAHFGDVKESVKEALKGLT